MYHWADSGSSSGDSYKSICWNDEDKKFTLGDFSAFCALLDTLTGDYAPTNSSSTPLASEIESTGYLK
jgi:hypothetical protein